MFWLESVLYLAQLVEIIYPWRRRMERCLCVEERLLCCLTIEEWGETFALFDDRGVRRKRKGSGNWSRSSLLCGWKTVKHWSLVLKFMHFWIPHSDTRTYWHKLKVPAACIYTKITVKSFNFASISTVYIVVLLKLKNASPTQSQWG